MTEMTQPVGTHSFLICVYDVVLSGMYVIFFFSVFFGSQSTPVSD